MKEIALNLISERSVAKLETFFPRYISKYIGVDPFSTHLNLVPKDTGVVTHMLVQETLAPKPKSTSVRRGRKKESDGDIYYDKVKLC